MLWKNEVMAKNVASTKVAPKVPDDEMVIVKDVADLVDKLKTSARLYVPAMVSLFTGMRLGEVLALRWKHVDLERKAISVRKALEHTKARTAFASSRQSQRPVAATDARREGASRLHRGIVGSVSDEGRVRRAKRQACHNR
jgi:integrase